MTEPTEVGEGGRRGRRRGAMLKRAASYTEASPASRGKVALKQIPEEEKIEIFTEDQDSDATRLEKERKIQNRKKGKTHLSKNYRVKKAGKSRQALRREVAQDTLKMMTSITKANGALLPGLSYRVNIEDIPPLNLENNPNAKPHAVTTVKVVKQDVFDIALMLQSATEFLGAEAGQRICVLNLTNPDAPGGLWREGAEGQEAEMFYRSTLSKALLPEYYPFPDRTANCVYTPNVVIFKECGDFDYSKMRVEMPEALPHVGVISVSMPEKPAVDIFDRHYKDPADREITINYMRLILRVAASTHHCFLVLDALGSGNAGHPGREVANCWLQVLNEDECKGWFHTIVFAIKYDRIAASDYSHILKNNMGIKY
ncbi:hypothetical protein N7490_008007 [Penicillium lividum]|nr:hypothetical protein N7490_008007 [Penicillium lividum]